MRPGPPTPSSLGIPPLTLVLPSPPRIASLDYSHDGALLAIASSYTFDEGEKECAVAGAARFGAHALTPPPPSRHPKDQIFIHKTAEN